MRSFYGNNPFSISIGILRIILLYSSVAYTDEYLISYNSSVKNSILIYQNLSITLAMQKCFGKQSDTLILTKTSQKETVKKTIFTHEDKFIAFLYNLGIDIHSYTTNINYIENSFTTLTFKTQCFNIESFDSYIKISILQETNNK